MDFQESTDNPLVQLALKIQLGELQLNQAIGIAASDEFCDTVEESHLWELFRLTKKHQYEEFDAALYLSCLNVSAANKINRSSEIWGQIEGRHALLLYQNGQVYESLFHMWRARDIFEASGNQDMVATTDFYLAVFYDEAGMRDLGKDQLDSALKTLVDAAEPKAEVVVGRMEWVTQKLVRMGHVNQGVLGFYGSSIEYLFKLGQPGLAINAKSYVAEALTQLGRHDEALAQWQEASIGLREIGDLFAATVIDVKIAFIYNSLGRYEEALVILRECRRGFSHMPSLKFRCLYGEGFALAGKGDLEEAKETFEEAVDVVENMRGAMPEDRFRQSFLESKNQVYHGLIRFLLFNEHPDYASALEYLERLKTRSLVEMLERSKQSAESRGLKESVLGGSPVYLEGSLMRYRDIVALVKDSATALIYLFPTLDATVVFIVTQDRSAEPIVEFAAYSGPRLQDDLHTLSENLATYKRELNGDASSWAAGMQGWETCLAKILQDLYENVFACSIEPHLKSRAIKKIVFVPYSGFHLLPLHAMHAPPGNTGTMRCILDEYEVAYTPSAKVLAHCLRMSTNRPLEPNDVAVTSADPYRNLFFSRYEARIIADLLGVEPLREVTKMDLIEKVREAQIFHYTGHADDMSLLLHNEREPSQPERFEVTSIFDRLRLPRASLVTLSACETGVISPGEADEYIGLPSAFLHAGAKSVISSLWPALDHATTLLMVKMYSLIREDQTLGKATALNKAQLWLRDSSPEERKQMWEKLTVDPDVGEYSSCKTRMRPGRLEFEQILTADFFRLRYWAGFICTGMGWSNEA
jgi:CHAT domain-containing protein